MANVGRTLTLKPDSMIEKGSATYSIDPLSGQIQYSVDINVHVLFMTHELKTAGKYKVDPKLLVSANVRPNEVLDFGPVTITVKSLQNKTALADVEVKGYASGEVILSLNKPTIELIHLNAQGTFMGMAFNLEAQ